MARTARESKEVKAVRESILQHAMDILVEEGYPSLSMAKIGSRAQMTAPNIYNYFDNKEQIFLEIHNRAFDLLHAHLRDAVATEEDAFGKVERLFEAYVDFGIHNRRFYEIMFCIPTPKYSDYKGTFAEKAVFEAKQTSLKVLEFAFRTVEDFLSKCSGVEEGDTRQTTLRAWFLLHGMISLNINRMLAEIDDNPEALVKEMAGKAIQSLKRETGREAYQAER